MPYAVDLRLNLAPTDKPLFSLMRGLHAKVKEWVLGHWGDTILTDRKGRFQPYVIAPLYPLGDGLWGASLKWLAPLPAGEWRKFTTALKARVGESFECNYCPVQLVEVLNFSQESYADLMACAEAHQNYCFTFLSPTSFGHGKTLKTGKHRDIFSYPLPDPLRLFQGLYYRWNQFSDAGDYSLDASVVNQIDHYMQIETVREFQAQRWICGYSKGKPMQRVGFTGEVVYSMPLWLESIGTEPEPGYLQAIHALAHYARWAGVGEQATMGYGWVDVKSW